MGGYEDFFLENFVYEGLHRVGILPRFQAWLHLLFLSNADPLPACLFYRLSEPGQLLRNCLIFGQNESEAEGPQDPCFFLSFREK